MNLLALDTSTVACSVALQCGDALAFRHAEEPRAHTRLLLPIIKELLAEAGIQVSDLDAVILGNGPGSFIGIRIAASVAQGLCFGAATDLVPVSSLEAVAAAVFENDDCQRVLVAQDARMHEVYLAGYERGVDGLPIEFMPLCLHGAARLENLPQDCCAAGAGWSQHGELWETNRDQLSGRVDPDYPHARDLLRIGAARREQGAAIAPERLQPAYVRERVAMPPGETEL